MKTAWADPFLLHLIALFPALLLAAVLLWWRRRREVAEALGDPVLVRRLAGTDLRRFPGGRAVLLVLAGALLGIAAAGPRWGNPATAARRERRRGAGAGCVQLHAGGGRGASRGWRGSGCWPARWWTGWPARGWG